MLFTNLRAVFDGIVEKAFIVKAENKFDIFKLKIRSFLLASNLVYLFLFTAAAATVGFLMLPTVSTHFAVTCFISVFLSFSTAKLLNSAENLCVKLNESKVKDLFGERLYDLKKEKTLSTSVTVNYFAKIYNIFLIDLDKFLGEYTKDTGKNFYNEKNNFLEKIIDKQDKKTSWRVIKYLDFEGFAKFIKNQPKEKTLSDLFNSYYGQGYQSSPIMQAKQNARRDKLKAQCKALPENDNPLNAEARAIMLEDSKELPHIRAQILYTLGNAKEELVKHALGCYNKKQEEVDKNTLLSYAGRLGKDLGMPSTKIIQLKGVLAVNLQNQSVLPDLD